MSLEVIYVVRHGFRSNWLVDPKTGNYSASIPSPTGISADPALTAHGVDQAKELGAHLLTVDPTIEAVYSSPYYRCLQTIMPFVDLRAEQESRLRQGNGGRDADGSAATTIRPESGIAEWYGAADFEHPSPASPEMLKTMFPRLDEHYSAAAVPATKGETIQELYERLARSLGAIVDQCDAEGLRAVVLCSHAAPIIAMGRVLTGIVPDSVETEDFQAFTCGLSVFRRRDVPTASRSSTGKDIATAAWQQGQGVRGGWDCEMNSDCKFLSTGEERGWRFSGDESFRATDPPSQDDAGMALGVVVEGRGHQHGHNSARHHHL